MAGQILIGLRLFLAMSFTSSPLLTKRFASTVFFSSYFKGKNGCANLLNVSGKHRRDYHMKKIIFITVAILFTSQSNAQNLNIKKIDSPSLIRILNAFKIFSDTTTNELSLRVLDVNNESGSAGFEENDEVTSNIYVAVSEFDEAPQQSLFSISSMYNPVFLKWNLDNPKQPEFTIEYGVYSARIKKTFIVSINNLLLKK